MVVGSLQRSARISIIFLHNFPIASDSLKIVVYNDIVSYRVDATDFRHIKGSIRRL